MWTVCWQGCAALASLAVDDAVAQQVAALGGSAIVMAVRHHIDSGVHFADNLTLVPIVD